VGRCAYPMVVAADRPLLHTPVLLPPRASSGRGLPAGQPSFAAGNAPTLSAPSDPIFRRVQVAFCQSFQQHAAVAGVWGSLPRRRCTSYQRASSSGAGCSEGGSSPGAPPRLHSHGRRADEEFYPNCDLGGSIAGAPCRRGILPKLRRAVG
jgi:hypothetical protein